MVSTSGDKYNITAQLSEDDEIVISGLSGRYPNSANVAEFAHNLYNKIDMVDDAEKRWRHSNPEIPKRMGKTSGLEKFDATFFGVHYKQAHTMDPQGRLLIEHAYEAILDAGMNPKSLRGSRTGVFMGACFAEAERTWFYENVPKHGFGITGCSRAMLANRVSYTLGLTGPSFLCDTACSSSMYALDCAYKAMRNGECDAAIVGGSNLLLHPYVTLQFARLGVLAPDGFCRPFDQDATGYVRAEAICCVFLQKAKDCKRLYAHLIHTKTNCDGYKEEGITYPSGKMQMKLLTEFYQDINIDPSTLDYVEAHSTGTVVGDPEECHALDKVFCTNRKIPLPVGSVKSNMGHSESTSGACSIAKVILAFENGIIPPNINFKKSRDGILSLTEGRLQVVSEPQPLAGPLVAVNSFGFGGANAHALLRAHNKEKVNKGIPTDGLPRLVIWSGRTELAINTVLDDVSKRPLDAEFVCLLHNNQTESVPSNVFRGFGVFKHVKDENAVCVTRDVQHYSGFKRPIVWVFSGMGSQWTQMGLSLLNIPIFRSSIQKSHDILSKKGLNLINILTSADATTFDHILHSFVGIAAIQIGIVDVMRVLGIQPDLIIGHSVGELGCAYADGCFTAEQMILAAYSRGMASIESKVIRGSMAAIGLGYRKMRTMLAPGIEIACHNGPDSSTISGPADKIAEFVKELKEQGVFAREVPCSNIPYHSSYIAEMGPRLLARLNEVIKNPKKRSEKWLSTSVPKNRWDQEKSQISDAFYHTNNLLSPVLFEETSNLLPKDALTIEIAPHGLLQAILKTSMPSAIHIGMTQRGHKNNDEFFIGALGKIFTQGVDMLIANLYPPVAFPVSKGTPMISSLIKWDHSEDWFVTKIEMQKKNLSGERKVSIGLTDQEYEYVVGHTIDGRVLFPATAYLFLAWETLAMMKGVLYFDIDVEFEDIKFLRATSLTKESDIEFTIMIQPGSGSFEISEGNTALVTGFIKQIENQKLSVLPDEETTKAPILNTKDFYKELRLRGYHYNGAFKSVVEARGDGLGGKVKWDLNWVSFMDCLLQIQIVGKDSRSLILPTGLQKLTINTRDHGLLVKEMGDPENQIFDVKICKDLLTLQCGGIEIVNMQTSVVGRRRPPGIPVLESYQFISHMPTPKLSTSDGVRVCVQLALENVSASKVKVVEVDNQNQASILSHFYDALADLPLVTSDLMLLTPSSVSHDNVHVENGKLSSQSKCLFVVASGCIKDQAFLESASASLVDNGFIISREKAGANLEDLNLPPNFNLIALVTIDNEVLVLMQNFKRKFMGTPKVIQISAKDEKFEWLEQTKSAMKNGSVILVAEQEKASGVVGLVNCIRREPEGFLVSCVFVDDLRAPNFDMQNPFYKTQMKLGLAINVYKYGKWGTYRHLQIVQKSIVHPIKEHAYVNALIKSDLSSLSWISGPFNSSKPKGELVRIQYASLNFRDVMLATGKLSADVFADNRLEHECVLGFEYAGVTSSGRRVMGMVTTAALSTHVECDEVFTWDCPDNWSLADAASIPAVYGTVYSAFFLSARIVKGKAILIHAGSGGVGLAAIRVALAYGLEVYTTVSTEEKKKFLLKTFPTLKENNIGNSRDITFERMVHMRTHGKGVDYVLNSLAGEKLQASIRCLGQGGKFLEIGKFDMANDTKIGLGNFLKELSFHSIMVDKLFKASNEDKLRMKNLLENDFQNGVIQPLKTNIFKAGEVEQAFRYLASGKHVGKVLLQIRENENDAATLPISLIPRVYCNPNYSYIIPGGLGGFGLELADWLVLRGCRKLVLSSSRGITKPYQAYRIKVWESYGVKTIVNTSDISTYNGCEQLIKAAIELGTVGGIFNLAVVLRDALLENQDVAMFMECMAPKAVATKHLDEVSRKLCPKIQYFVVFSSVSCGRGNAGQSNYGMANSVMERIMEKRFEDGLPAKAIQWGAVGEVGLVADMQEDKLDMEIGGTLQQRISSCLDEMDPLMTSSEPLVASMVVAEKRVRGSGQGNIVETIMNIMSIRDIKSISMDTTLSELGMDSLMAVEIKQTLEREYELFLTPQDLRSLTFMKLKEFAESRENNENKVKLRVAVDSNFTGVAILLRNLGDESNCEKQILRLRNRHCETNYKSCAMIIPGIEGVVGNAWHKLGESMNMPTFILQSDIKSKPESINDVTLEAAKDVHNHFKSMEAFYLIGYSFGSLVTLQIAGILEEAGLRGSVVLLDGSPPFLKKLANDQISNTSDESIYNYLMVLIVPILFPEDNGEIVKVVVSQPTWDDKLKKLIEFQKDQGIYSDNYVTNMCTAIAYRTKICLSVDLENIVPLNHTPITLIRPTEVSVIDIDEDYGLNKYSTQKINLKFVEGNHMTMLDNIKLTQILNDLDPVLQDHKSFNTNFVQK